MDGELRRVALAAVHLPLTSGAVPMIALLVAVASAAWLFVHVRRVTRRAIVTAVGLAAVGTAAMGVLVEWLWQPLSDGLPTEVYLWVGAMLLFGGLAVVGLVAGSTAARALTAVAGVLVLVAGLVQVNVSLHDYPTVAAALGHPPVVDAGSTEVLSRDGVDDLPTDRTWRAPVSMPRQGEITEVDIPGTVSGFGARPASIYFPPAYLAQPRADLPVLVLMTGQPGRVTDWITGGNLVGIMDSFAARHDGLAPVVVMADALGTFEANPMCMDSGLGNVETYLSVDVPNWVKRNLQVSGDPARWAIGGFSYGGTCSLQMAVAAPEVYPTFVDMSGEDEQRAGTRAESVIAAFGDDSAESAARFDSATPLVGLAAGDFTSSAGAFVVGADDAEFGPQTRRTYEATLVAGMDVHFAQLPGGHGMGVWSPALNNEMDWLAERLGLVS